MQSNATEQTETVFGQKSCESQNSASVHARRLHATKLRASGRYNSQCAR